MNSVEGIIYRYISPNGKIYIGLTINESHRKAVHRNLAKNPKDYFHRALNKYGFDSFKYDVIFKTSSKNENKLKYLLDVMETYYIRKYNSTNPDKGYNLTLGGEGMVGFRHSEESRIKMSKSHKGKDNHLKGVILTTEQKRKKAKSLMGDNYKINQYTKEGIFIASYETYVEAANAVGALKTSIHNCTSGKSKTCKGYIWKKEI